jgi:hypothetical protein
MGNGVDVSLGAAIESRQRRLLEALIVDNGELDRLEDQLSEFNLFEAVGAVRSELRHSDFLRFLLDPAENHGLGEYFLKSFLKRCLAGDSTQAVNAIDIDVADLTDAVVERERWSIDVLIRAERAQLVIAIENKVDSDEHSNQLDRYRAIVEREFPSYRLVLIYLTPEGDDASDAERWLGASYETIAAVVGNVIEARRSTLGAAVLTTLEHYRTLIGRHIVTESEIARLCRQIYRQHKEALDLIFEHRPDQQLDFKTILEEEVQAIPSLVLDHCTKSRVRFSAKVWDQDPRQLRGQGWTPTRRVLVFEFYNDPESLRFKLLIGPVSRDDDIGMAFRQAAFDVSQAHRSDFPGGQPALYPRFTTILSRDLLKKKDYLEAEGLPEKVREVAQKVLREEVPRALQRLSAVVGC